MDESFRIYHSDELTPSNKLDNVIYAKDHVLEGKIPLSYLSLTYRGRSLIVGSTDGELNDFIVSCKVPYNPLLMLYDMGDIRFYLEDDTALSYVYLGQDNGYGFFDVLIPYIPQSPDSMYIYCRSDGITSSLEDGSEPQVLYPGVVQYYPMVGSSASLIDRSGNDYHGVNQVNITCTDGIFGRAINWLGAGQWASVPNHLNQDLTFAFWLKTTQNSFGCTQWYSGTGILDGEIPGGAADFGIGMCTGHISFGVGSPDQTILSSFVSDGNPHFIVCRRSYSTGRIEIYIDNVLDAYANCATGYRNGPSTLAIGKILTNTNYFLGILEKMQIYTSIKSVTDLNYTPNFPVVGLFEQY